MVKNFDGLSIFQFISKSLRIASIMLFNIPVDTLHTVQSLRNGHLSLQLVLLHYSISCGNHIFSSHLVQRQQEKLVIGIHLYFKSSKKCHK